MPRIRVQAEEEGDNRRFRVEVDGDGVTTHEVTLSESYHRRLTGGKPVPPDELVRKSFEFLLERESNRSILRRFDLTVIGLYFPEYEAEIQRRLS